MKRSIITIHRNISVLTQPFPMTVTANRENMHN